MLMRFVRSVAQGALAVDFVLYLKALDWSVAAIGSLGAASSLMGAFLILITGPLSDRTGRRPFLIVYEVLPGMRCCRAASGPRAARGRPKRRHAVGVGLVGPMLPYWFAVRFGSGPSELGSFYSFTSILTGLASVITGEVSGRFGLVKSVVWVPLVGVATLIAMPLMPSYIWAAALYVLRSITNRGSNGARQAFGIGLVRLERRGLASSLNALSFRLPSALDPAATGWMMALGFINLPPDRNKCKKPDAQAAISSRASGFKLA